MRRLFRFKCTPAQHLAMMRRVLAIVLVMGIAYAGFSPMAVQAEEDLDMIDLELGGEGATSWSIPAVMPCQSGTKTITLHNAGSEDGSVIIWLSNIQSSEGANPEPETDISDVNGGELDDNLLLGLSASSGLSPNPRPPTQIINFPQSAAASNIIINPLDSGDTVTLTWDWKLPCETGNEAQGDIVSFDINFYLEDFLTEIPPPPPPPPPPPVPGGTPIPPPESSPSLPQACNCPDKVLANTDPCLCTAASDVALGALPFCYQQDVVAVTNDAPLVFPVGDTIVTWTMTDITGNRQTCTQMVTVTEGDHYFEIDMLGQITKIEVECPDKSVVGTHVVSDPDDMHFLTIENGTHVVCPDSTQCIPYPEIIVMSLSEETLPVPDGMAMISPAYDFIGYVDKDLLYPACAYVNFDRPVMMQLSYDTDDPLLGNSSAPFIAFYDIESGKWRKTDDVPGGMVAEVGKANGLTQHLSTFAVMVEVPTEVSGVAWWLIVAIVGGSILLFWLIWYYRRRRRQA